MGISRREFARREKCDEKLVRLALQRGDLVAFDDGTIDEGLCGTPWRGKGRKQARNGVSAASAPDQGAADSFLEAQRRKENYLALLRKLEFEVKSGQLIEWAAVEKTVRAVLQEYHDAWVNWPARIAPLAASELGIDQIRLAVVLEKHVREQLVECADHNVRLSRPGAGRGDPAGSQLDGFGVVGPEAHPVSEGVERAGAVAD